MKVYIVTCASFASFSIDSVHKTKEKAEEYCKYLNRTGIGFFDWEEHEVED